MPKSGIKIISGTPGTGPRLAKDDRVRLWQLIEVLIPGSGAGRGIQGGERPPVGPESVVLPGYAERWLVRAARARRHRHWACRSGNCWSSSRPVSVRADAVPAVTDPLRGL